MRIAAISLAFRQARKAMSDGVIMSNEDAASGFLVLYWL